MARKEMDRWRTRMASLEDGDRDPIAPQYLMSVVDKAAADDTVLTCDSGTIATGAARHWTIRGGREFFLADEPPLPGKADYEQAKKFAQAFLCGQPRKATIATTLLADKIQELRG
jgi:hypothetical protein